MRLLQFLPLPPDWRAMGIQEGNYKHASAPFSGHQLGRSIPGVFAEKFLIADADTTLAKIPEGVTLEQALMCVDVVTTGFTGAEYADIKFGDTVVVMGNWPYRSDGSGRRQAFRCSTHHCSWNQTCMHQDWLWNLGQRKF